MSSYRYLALSILTFFLVTLGLPAIAHNTFTFDNLKPISHINNTKFFITNSSPHPPISPPPHPISQSPTNSLEQGKQLYDTGRFAEAAEIWEQAARKLEQQRELPDRALSYNYLGIVYQDLGEWEKARNAIDRAIKLIPQINDTFLSAQILNTQGSFYLNTGNPEAALESWKQAENGYRSLKDTTGIIISQINQAQAWQTLGVYQQARKKLAEINQELTLLPDSLLKVRGLRSLGVTLQVVGDLEESQSVLSESLAIAKRLNAIEDIGETLFRLGNTARAKGDIQAALNFYQQVTSISTNPLNQLEAQLNQLSLLVDEKEIDKARALLPEIQANLANLPASRGGIYAHINLAKSLMEMGDLESAQILAKAVQQARELSDIRAESYALGQLGNLYEQAQQWSDALSLTQQAILLAQKINATDISASWYWQEGRILKARDRIPDAIAAYDRAVNALQYIRQDLVAVNPDVQFSFREQVEPVYRQFVQLLLQNVDNLPEITKQQQLQRSREVIEGLQLAELENFFREACLNYQSKPIEEIDSQAAVIYPIILDNSIEVILSLPGQSLQHYQTNLSEAELTKVFEELRQTLNPVFLPAEVLPSAQKIYDWLVRPAETTLANRNIKTLVFVLDGVLRSLPMSVLHDGKQYLIERYSIALTPGLQLLESRQLSPKQLRTLAGGLIEARQGFAPLPGVKEEIAEIAENFRTQVLVDQNFTRANFQNELERVPFSVVHLATHGQFSSKAEDTFLLTWDSRINVKDLDRVLRGREGQEPIELLVLSACQTAKGDNRAALGLAGVAVRSGARSTLATLWSVQDRSTAQLIAEFYRLLTQNRVNKAEALRQAQLYLLKSNDYKHPYYWSPFVLVGNWR
ncbi:MAG TPA: CHAT domain-containing protein [Leptolyngbyaceae cyanobacterium]